MHYPIHHPQLRLSFRSLLIVAIFLAWYPGTVKAQPDSWFPRGLGGGGALFNPAVSPHDPVNVFVACDMSELFHTTNFGVTWDVVPFPQVRAFQETRVQFTSSPDILYTLCLEAQTERRYPARTTDGGLTWTPLPTDPTDGESYYILADHQRTDRLVVTSYSNIYFSNNSGMTFTSIYNDDNDGAYLAGAFWNGDTIFIATARGVLVSTDNGAVFAMAVIPGIPAGEGIVSLAGAKRGGTTRLFCVTLDMADIYPKEWGNTGQEHWSYRSVYRVDYGPGTSWTSSTSGIGTDDHPFFVGMAADDIDVAYIAGGSATDFPTILKTTNGGTSWNAVFHTANNQNIVTGWSGNQGDKEWYFGEYALGFDVSRSNPNVAVISDWGFVHGTTDGGATWRQMYVTPSGENPVNAPTPKGRYYRTTGLENTSCWWIHWSDAKNLFVAFTDITATRSTDFGVSWSRDYTGLDFNSVYHVVQKTGATTLYAAVSTVHDIYQSRYLEDAALDGGNGGIRFSTDGGKAWTTLHDFGHPVLWLAIDPAHPDRLYASVVHSTEGGIYVSDDIQNGSGSSWRRLAAPPRTVGHPLNILVLKDGSLLATYSGHRDNSGAFTASSGLFLSTDDGSTWLDRSDPGMHYWTKDVVIDPHDQAENTWYVSVFSGWGGAPNGLGGIYRTTDRGATWSKISDLDRVESCRVHPGRPGEMYATTEDAGLLYTKNLNDASPLFTPVTGYPFKHPLRVLFNPYDQREIWVTSFGNGLRVAGDIGTSVPSRAAAGPGNMEVSIHPNPVRFTAIITVTARDVESFSLKLYDMLGREIATLADGRQTSGGEYRFRFDASRLASGAYWLRLVSDGAVKTRQLFVAR